MDCMTHWSCWSAARKLSEPQVALRPRTAATARHRDLIDPPTQAAEVPVCGSCRSHAPGEPER